MVTIMSLGFFLNWGRLTWNLGPGLIDLVQPGEHLGPRVRWQGLGQLQVVIHQLDEELSCPPAIGMNPTCCLRLATILSTWPLALLQLSRLPAAVAAEILLWSVHVGGHLLALKSRLIWVWLLASNSGMDSWSP